LRFKPQLDNRHAFLRMRWLVIILASCLMFSTNSGPGIESLLVLAGLLVASNAALTFFPLPLFARARSENWVSVADGVLFSVALFFLRPSYEFPVYLIFIGLFVLTLAYKSFNSVTLAMVAVSVTSGIAGSYGLPTVETLQHVLGSSLLFLAAVLYVFVQDRMDREVSKSRGLIEEASTAEVAVEITRQLADSTTPEVIHRVVVSHLAEAMGGQECQILKLNGDDIVLEASSREGPGVTARGRITSAEVRELIREAHENRRRVVHDRRSANGRRVSIAVPIVVDHEVFGFIFVPGGGMDAPPSDIMLQMFDVVAGTTASSLRNARALEEMKKMARTDFLTGLSNYRHFQSILSQELGRARRHNRSLSLLLIDLDLLKTVNDRFGHQAGDAVIRGVARRIQQTCREIDFAARYGGEEYVVILPETDLDGALLAAERIRKDIEDTEVGEVGRISASIGVANYPVNATNREDLIRIADQALYVAKDAGRNQVAHFKYQFTTL
jgi:diguanylate cyclase (GGDEF)-like protein